MYIPVPTGNFMEFPKKKRPQGFRDSGQANWDEKWVLSCSLPRRVLFVSGFDFR